MHSIPQETAQNKTPPARGSIKTRASVADALVLKYYEETDAKKEAFGHELTDDDWLLEEYAGELSELAA